MILKSHLKRGMPSLSSVAFVLVWFAIAPVVRAVVPAPDGGYPGFNTAEGQNALFNLTTGVGNTAVGWFSLFSDTDGSFNTGVGAGTLLFNVGNQSKGDGVENTAIGTAALLFNNSGARNTAVGTQALFSNTEGERNTAIGRRALDTLVNGSKNTAVGEAAGFQYVGAETNNVLIGIGTGTPGENDTIHIADTVGLGVTATDCFVGGIYTSPVGPAPLTVMCGSNGKLSANASSRRFKHDIKPIDKASEAILALKPVTFRYNSDPTNTPWFGLIAEDVAEINSDLIVRDKGGKPLSVRYEQVNAMLLNEFLKEHRKVEQLEKQVAALTAVVQKVSTQVEMNRTAPQTVCLPAVALREGENNR
jgi:trimeric autotransporter adhesin